jgi:hypothetical protein
MNIIDKLLEEWSYRCPDGLVDLKDPAKLSILNEILKEFDVKLQTDEDEEMLREILSMNIKVGSTYTLNSDLGNFKKGDKVTIMNKIPFGDDWKIIMSNEEGIKDDFIIDKDDEFDFSLD